MGLDIHKKFIEYCVLDGEGDEVATGRIESSREELQGLVVKLKKQGAVQASLEACGCFIWVFDLLVRELSREVVHVAQPSRIKVVANSMEKNDANDAWWLAYLLFEGRLPESFVVEGVMRNLRIAERELRSYTDARSDELRRFKSHFAQEGTKIPKNWHASKIGRTRVVARIKETREDRHRALIMLLKQIKKLSSQMLYWRAHGGIVQGTAGGEDDRREPAWLWQHHLRDGGGRTGRPPALLQPESVCEGHGTDAWLSGVRR